MFLQIKFIAIFSLFLVLFIGAVNEFTTYAKMALLSLITEQSTVPCFPTILFFPGDHFGVDK